MKEKKIIIVNNKGTKLVGWLYKNTSETIIIMCHGIHRLKNFPGMDAVFQAYYKTGSSVFYFDFSGYGESGGVKDMSIKQRVLDVNTIVNYFANEYKHIILYGISFSGIVAAIAASSNKQITHLITINGLFSLHIRTLPVRLAYMIYSYLCIHPSLWREVIYIKKHVQMQDITVPVLVVVGEEDKIVTPRQSMAFYNRLKTEKTMLAVPKGDHALMKQEFEQFTKGIPQWIKKYVV